MHYFLEFLINALGGRIGLPPSRFQHISTIDLDVYSALFWMSILHFQRNWYGTVAKNIIKQRRFRLPRATPSPQPTPPHFRSPPTRRIQSHQVFCTLSRPQQGEVGGCLVCHVAAGGSVARRPRLGVPADRRDGPHRRRRRPRPPGNRLDAGPIPRNTHEFSATVRSQKTVVAPTSESC